MNIYKTCPDVHNERFRLRLVTQEDCEDLLKVYSDVKAVPLFNGDNCNGDDFYYATLERMQQAMSFWIWSYENGWFVRMSILDLSTGCAVGTIELCYRDSEDTGVLRLDLRSDYENEADISAILSLIVDPSYPSYRTIGEAVGLSRNAVKNKVDSLVEKQLIYTEPTTIKLKDGRTRNGNLLYTIRPLDAAKQYYIEQQAKENEKKKALQEWLEKLERMNTGEADPVEPL